MYQLLEVQCGILRYLILFLPYEFPCYTLFFRHDFSTINILNYTNISKYFVFCKFLFVFYIKCLFFFYFFFSNVMKISY